LLGIISADERANKQANYATDKSNEDNSTNTKYRRKHWHFSLSRSVSPLIEIC